MTDLVIEDPRRAGCRLRLARERRPPRSERRPGTPHAGAEPLVRPLRPGLPGGGHGDGLVDAHRRRPATATGPAPPWAVLHAHLLLVGFLLLLIFGVAFWMFPKVAGQRPGREVGWVAFALLNAGAAAARSSPSR